MKRMFAMILALALLFSLTSCARSKKELDPVKCFNAYANYLLYGTESTEDITGEYKWGYRYYAGSLGVIFEDSYSEYLENLKSKYELLYESSAEKLGDYNDIFWLFYYCSLYPDMTLKDIVLARLDGINEEEIRQNVEDYYAPFLESSNSLVQTYGRAKIVDLLDDGLVEEEVVFPKYVIEIFSKIWEMKGEFYD